ncbi:G-type lectin S-receptor-like serine/threonine-protein kinase At1g61460 [Euphorbia lathyris]|uniref:G-type lectin S-receptor-like serine/threonine-protein kinase At1g61460 n=1 Tax=Euphorbia lathyris TaxID=212925 RepID=UPI0033135693
MVILSNIQDTILGSSAYSTNSLLFNNLTAAEPPQPVLNGWKLWITVITTLSVAIISSSLFIYHFWKEKLAQVEGKDLLTYNFNETTPEEPPAGEEHGRGITGYQIPLFKFSSVCTATDDFSATNKLGKGGFGAIYKGILDNEEVIAVKRLTKLVAGKGSKEVKNEAMLIAELRHDNLARLLGCCLDGNEHIIIYEYFKHRSLDLFLFGLYYSSSFIYIALILLVYHVYMILII